jgi:hypothetical protein
MKLVVVACCAVAVACLPAWAVAQETKPQSPPAGAQAGPPAPTPGPEHQLLKNDEGVWDATVEATMAPGAPPSVSKGVETNTLMGGGLWLLSDFKSEMMGQPFQGHGVMGYDPVSKKYVGTWVDTMSTRPSSSEATYDAATKTMTGWIEGPDETGKVVKMRETTEWKDPNTRVFTIYMKGPDGKEAPGLKITYKRRK